MASDIGTPKSNRKSSTADNSPNPAKQSRGRAGGGSELEHSTSTKKNHLENVTSELQSAKNTIVSLEHELQKSKNEIHLINSHHLLELAQVETNKYKMLWEFSLKLHSELFSLFEQHLSCLTHTQSVPDPGHSRSNLYPTQQTVLGPVSGGFNFGGPALQTPRPGFNGSNGDSAQQQKQPLKNNRIHRHSLPPSFPSGEPNTAGSARVSPLNPNYHVKLQRQRDNISKFESIDDVSSSGDEETPPEQKGTMMFDGNEAADRLLFF